MTAAHCNAWLDLLEVSCAKSGLTHLDVIVDQAASDVPLLPSVRCVAPPLQWQSLFTGLPEEGATELAPLLLRVDLIQPLQRQWLGNLIQASRGRSQLLILASPWPFAALAEYLGRCLEATNGGCDGLLRYYDPRLFPLLFSHVLQPEQQQLLLRPAVFWSWLDRDDMPAYLPGCPGVPLAADDCLPMALSDNQLETLGCASDATLAMGNLLAGRTPHWGAEQYFHQCYAAMIEATEAGLLLVSEREAFALERLLAPE
ncbi:DUF4123 domain-containing protein [Pseudomonas sp. RGM2987]|uniref:DUF4123 domain-containing protein n=1 Tax=Pseudomonas sp. RGM2987 TaxID=2930090 RepID=UPI001FD632DE|nr:DUF4123 domain-containing protein [Pseudomonas sp. RGM2987]MCJ8207132.1 DUF4123 domain-containing protein [Pseudomonas sp. RGM2987]